MTPYVKILENISLPHIIHYFYSNGESNRTKDSNNRCKNGRFTK